MMLRAFFFLCFFCYITNTSKAQEPWAIMTGQSVLEIRSGIRHIYERLGRQDLVTELDKSGLNNLLSGNLNGLDLKRPLGCVMLPNESGTGVLLAFIPITGEQAFLEFLKRHSVQVDTANTGKPVVSIPKAGTMHLRFDQHCAWLAYSSSDLDGTLPDLSRAIPDQHREAHLASTVYLDRLPRDHRSQFLLHAQKGLSWLFKGDGLSMSKATEILILPLAGLMLNRLSSEATTLTILANTDIKTDKLWAKLLITPKQNTRLMTQAQERAVQPIRYDIPASLWARLRGKSSATAESAAKEAFSNGQSEQITAQITGADQLVVSVDFSGAFLTYHAALDRLEEPREMRLPRRERRRDPASDRH